MLIERIIGSLMESMKGRKPTVRPFESAWFIDKTFWAG
jgi:hypothetical protein